MTVENVKPVHLKFVYKNHKDEIQNRTVEQPRIWCATSWCKEPQWMMTAYDNDKGEVRNFVLKNILAWGHNK